MRETDVAEAIAVLRCQESFYDFDIYNSAVDIIQRWTDLLSLDGFPYQFNGFSLNPACAANLNSSADITDFDYLERVNAPFAPAYSAVLQPLLNSTAFDVIGVSINYLSQLPFALKILKLCREAQPQAMIIAGGTDVSDIVKYAVGTDPVWRIFADCDGIVVGEGESAFVAILEAIAAGDRRFPTGPGLMARGNAQKTTPKNEDLRHLGAPDYTIFQTEDYWSPQPVFLYSPTRGCYWNQCTFCDYGLNFDMPTSPSREAPIDQVLTDLRGMSAQSPFVYFAVDAISPRYLKRLSNALVKGGVKMFWSAELRLEPRIAQPEIAQELREAGCVAISFGLESASQRVLDQINKGVDIAQVPDVLVALRAENIGSQLMAFTGFPGETPDEARDTFQFLRDHAELWTLAFVGEFGLTAGAIIAKQPEAFGIRRVYAGAGDDIPRQLLWESADGAVKDRFGVLGLARPSLPKDLQRFDLDRPWVGGIDSSHSILYFAKYGASLVGQRAASWRATNASDDFQERNLDCGLHYESFVTKDEIRDFISASRREGRSRSYAEVMCWYAHADVAHSNAASERQ